MTAATSLLDFILNLLKDPQAHAEFRASPEHVLAANGLTGVSAADIRGTLPLVTDNRYVGLNSGHHVVSLSAASPSGDSDGARAVIHYLHRITRTYRYDDHGSHAHDPGRGNIWAMDGVTHSGPAPGPGGESAAGRWMGGQYENFDLHGFGSGAAMTAVGGTTSRPVAPVKSSARTTASAFATRTPAAPLARRARTTGTRTTPTTASATAITATTACPALTTPRSCIYIWTCTE